MAIFIGLCVGVAAVAAMAMHYFDAKMQRHRKANRVGVRFSFVPIRWFDPDDYDEEGRQLRGRTVRAFTVMIVFFAIAFLARMLSAFKAN